MNRIAQTALVFMLMITAFASCAQENIFGLWQVEQVIVGEKSMTPVAKWFRIESNGHYQTGNGWLQNGAGIWNFDSEKQLFSSCDSLNIED